MEEVFIISIMCISSIIKADLPGFLRLCILFEAVRGCAHILCRTVSSTIFSDTIQNVFSTLVKNLKKEIQVIFCEVRRIYIIILVYAT